MDACRLANTTLASCPDTSSRIPLPKMRSPYTDRRTPMKNHIEIPDECIPYSLPEVDIQRQKDNDRDCGPEILVLKERNGFFRGQFGGAVDQAVELRYRPGLAKHAHNKGDND